MGTVGLKSEHADTSSQGATAQKTGSGAAAKTGPTAAAARGNKRDRESSNGTVDASCKVQSKSDATASHATEKSIPEGFYSVYVRGGTTFTVLERYQDLQIIGTGAQGVVW